MRARVSRALIVAFALWAAWRGAGYALDPSRAYAAESAWLVFAAALLTSWFVQRPDIPETAATPPGQEPPAWWAIVPVGASLLLYAPMLGIGLLSDDFVLLHRAQHGVLIERSWEFVRPLPLAVWQAIAATMPEPAIPAALHALNAVLHGLNAWLVFLCAARLGVARAPAVMAAALFMAWPFQVESVAWAAGVFDLSMTLFVLASIASALNERASPGMRTAAVVAFTSAAILCKETAVAGPFLIALTGIVAPAPRRRAIWPCAAAAAAVIVAYGAWRVASAFSAPGIPEGPVIAHKLLTRPFGALAFPVHRDVLASVPGLGMALAVAWPLLLAAVAWRWRRDTFRMLAFGVGWVLLSVSPLLTTFFVADNLESSRYLYLGSTMWAVAIVMMMSSVSPAVSTMAIVASTLLVFAHQQPWHRAATVRDQVIAAAARSGVACNPHTIEGLPDNEAGAHVFRNGFGEAMAALGIATGAEGCAFERDGAVLVLRAKR